MSTGCPHAPAQRMAARASTCETCGDAEQLRSCDVCGYTGCPDSHEAHATAHARDSGHHVFSERDVTGDGWTWCDACGVYLE